MSLNKQQQRVFDASINRNVAVSAGAGTGKSRTLKTKVIDLITRKENPIKPAEFLIVTFTNEATNSLRNDIKKEIRKLGLTNLYSEVDSMHIDTLDSFRLFVVKKYASKLGISKDISILDESIYKLEKLKKIEELLNKLYLSKDETLIKFIEEYETKKDDGMKELIMYISDCIDINKWSKEEFICDYYAKFLDTEVMKEKLYFFLKDYYKEVPELVATIRGLAEDNIYDIEKDKENAKAAALLELTSQLDGASNVDEIIDGLTYLKTCGVKLNKGSEFEGYEDAKAAVEKLKKLKTYNVYNIIEVDLEFNKRFIPFFISIAYDLKVELEKFKKLHKLYTFNDIAHLALKVLEDDECKEEIKNSFKVVMIDEYQDNSDLDDDFFTKIANNNLFVVGDVKQSIYGFKGANPERFNEKFETISDENYKLDKTEPYTMNINYRSRKEILDSVNKVFNDFMTEKRGGVNYKDDNHSLVYESNLVFDTAGEFEDKDKGIYSLLYLDEDELINKFNEASGDNKTKAFFDTVSNKGTAKFVMASALNIASRINQNAKVAKPDFQKVVENGEEISKLVGGKQEIVKFSDFGVLTRSGPDVNYCREVFSKLGIPVNLVVDEEITSNVMVETMLSIIRCMNIIVNENFTDKEFKLENEFKLSFVSILRSFLYETDDFEIYQNVANTDYDGRKLLQNLKYRESDIYKKIFNFVNKHKFDSLSTIVSSMFIEFNFIENLQKLNNAVEFIQKYTLLLEKIKSMDEVGYQIEDLVFFFENIGKLNLTIEVRLVSDSNDAVTIETIHKSKGLEFPIVYVQSTNEFRTATNKLSTSYYANKELGFYLPSKFPDDSKTFFVSSYANFSMKAKALSEETRLFYVALTRAKEVCVCVFEKPLDTIPEKDECKTYQHIVASSGHNLPEDFYGFADSKVASKEKEFIREKVSIKTSSILFALKETAAKRPSIEVEEDVNEELLRTGTRYHEYMEIVDLKTKDVSFIKNEKERQNVRHLLENKVFDKLPDSSKIFKEYKYLDDNGITGIIDLLLVFNDHCVVIDYKLKNADDEKYAKQLGAYKAYVEKVFGLPTETKLISILGD